MVWVLDKFFSLFQCHNLVTVFLIVGLGNYGREYRLNRHNVGFMVIDNLSKVLDINLSKVQSMSLIGSGTYEGVKIILAKPQTYMNLSGQALSSLVRFYKINLPQILVIHDDLDLPLGTIRIRPSGGSAGHKGMISIIDSLRSNEFPRLRFGIGRPPGRLDPADYVLQNFSSAEQEALGMTIDRAAKTVISFFQDGLKQTMSQYNGPLQRN